MNILHMKYAVEIAKAGSINKAAEHLFMNQPNLSRALKELEASLGKKLFIRNPRGMIPTDDGELFLRHASNILRQVDEMEELFHKQTTVQKQFSVTSVAADYIKEAVLAVYNTYKTETAFTFSFTEKNTQETIHAVETEECNLGIIRYAEHFDRYYKELSDSKNIAYALVCEFCYMPIMHRASPLAEYAKIPQKETNKYTKVLCAENDAYHPAAPFAEQAANKSQKKIIVPNETDMYQLLANDINAFGWAPPVPKHILAQYDLVQHPYCEQQTVYKDMILHRKDYHFSETDNAFVAELCAQRRAAFYQKENSVL